MTLVAVAFVPHLLVPSYSGEPDAIILVSDSRISYAYKGETYDIAQKIHQFSSDSVIGYCGNVRLSQDVFKSLHYRLDRKKQLYNGSSHFSKEVGEVIKYKQTRLGDDYNSDFLLCLVNDSNIPELYFYSSIFNDGYQPHLIAPQIGLKIIGQDARERNQLEQYIRSAVSELKANDSLTCSSAMRKAMNDYIAGSNVHPVRKAVGGLLQAVMVEPHPRGVHILNALTYQPQTGDLEVTTFNDSTQNWEHFSNGKKQGETAEEPLTQFKRKPSN